MEEIRFELTMQLVRSSEAGVDMCCIYQPNRSMYYRHDVSWVNDHGRGEPCCQILDQSVNRADDSPIDSLQQLDFSLESCRGAWFDIGRGDSQFASSGVEAPSCEAELRLQTSATATAIRARCPYSISLDAELLICPLPSKDLAITEIEIRALKFDQKKNDWEPFGGRSDNHGVAFLHVLLELYCP